MVLSLKDACKVLDIVYPVVATRREVSKQFNQAAMKNHPDKFGPNGREANKRMALVSAARELLDVLFDSKETHGFEGHEHSACMLSE